MQAVADFYAGFALFMLVGSLLGLALMLLQPFFGRFRKDRPHRAPSAMNELPAHPRHAVHGPARYAA